MDPITAIGLVSGILTFVDFAGQIVAGTYEIYRSAAGSTEANAHIDTIVADLHNLTVDLGATVPCKTKNDIALRDLAAKCEVVSGKLQDILKTLKVSGSHTTWKSLKMKIKSMRKEPEIVELEKQLGDYKKEILLRLTMMLSQDQSNVKSKLDQLEDKMANHSSETAMQLACLRQDILKIAAKLAEECSGVSPSATTQMEDGIWEMRQSLQTLSSKIKILPKENIVLQNLFFPSMNLREESTHSAEKGTFDWIFEDEDEDTVDGEDESAIELYDPLPVNDWSFDGLRSQSDFPERDARRDRAAEECSERRAQSRASFLAWLRSGRGVFHVSGKAGSGKTTLMKYLCCHPRTKRELGTWAAGREKKLVFASFYFWNLGDPMQASLDGFLRSVLFETLKSCPDLIPLVFPDHWRGLENDMFFVPGHLFNSRDIENAFGRLISHGTSLQCCFCFFIDGLDEYKGESQDHVKLARTLQRWTSENDVKICASSRPHIEFDSLGLEGGIFHLHELTRLDIYLFSRRMIENDENFGQVKESYLRLVNEVVDLSEGVFLWARLAVSSLLAGMLRHDTTRALEAKLKATPQDIDKLYNAILDSLDPHDRKRAVKMLLLTAHYPFPCVPLNCLAYAWLDELEDPSFPPCDGIKPASWRPASTMTEDVQRQVKSLTRGLLEIVPAPSPAEKGLWESRNSEPLKMIQFYHKTVKEFIVNRQKAENNDSRGSAFLRMESYYRLILADLTVGAPSYRRAYWNGYMIIEVGESLFQDKLPLPLLDGFCRVLDDEEVDSRLVMASSCEGYFHGKHMDCGAGLAGERLSFVHMAAFAGQNEYVFREMLQRPELLKGDGKLHLLLSAALGFQSDLVSALLAQRSSPHDLITLSDQWDDPTAKELPRVPVWIAFLSYAARVHFTRTDIFDILEILLEHGGVDMTCCAFTVEEHHYDKQHEREGSSMWKLRSRHPVGFITLEDIVLFLKPKNMDRMLHLLNRNRQGSYFESIMRFVSLLVSGSEQAGNLSRLPKITAFNPLGSLPEGGERPLCRLIYGGSELQLTQPRVF